MRVTPVSTRPTEARATRVHETKLSRVERFGVGPPGFETDGKR
jgi:hypothetical protein